MLVLEMHENWIEEEHIINEHCLITPGGPRVTKN